MWLVGILTLLRQGMIMSCVFLQEQKPDLLLLQELKCICSDFPSKDISALGYYSAVHGQKQYNGVAIIAKSDVEIVSKGLINDHMGARFLWIKLPSGVHVINIYAPNGRDIDHPHYLKKLAWYYDLYRFLRANDLATQKTIIGGDFNIVPSDIDSWNAKKFADAIFHSELERKVVKDIIGLGFCDSFRFLHQQKQFSWWDYRQDGYVRNHGLRIDLLLTSKALVPTAAGICSEERAKDRPSDHAPIWVKY